MVHPGKALEILERLVAFDTTSHLSNRSLVSWVRAYLEQYGVSSVVLADATGQKHNLIATIGDASEAGIVLSGHTDVVPATAHQWSSDPFRLRLEDGKAFGRGTTDMKGFLSIILAAVPEMAQCRLNQPITLALSYDEEVGCLGAPGLIEHLRPDQRVIVGEPTDLNPGVRHKGGRVQSLKIAGLSAHSGTPILGVNAIDFAATAVRRLCQIDMSLAERKGDYVSNLTVTKIKGGGAINVVPAECEITWMLRAVSSDEARSVDAALATLTTQLDASLKQKNPRSGAWLETSCDVPPFERGELDTSFARLTKGRMPQNLSFGTEAGIFSEAGHDVMVCGPGNMAQGHTDDEYIEVQALADGCHFIAEVMNEASF